MPQDGPDSVKLSWTADTNTNQYVVGESINGGAYTYYENQYVTPGQNYFLDLAPPPNVPANFILTACYQDGHTEPSQPYAVLIPLPAPAASGKLISASQSVISWSSDANATSYDIYYSASPNGPFSSRIGGAIGSWPNVPTTCTISDTVGYYVVTADDDGTNSPASNVIVLGSVPPRTPWDNSCVDYPCHCDGKAGSGPAAPDPVNLATGAESNEPDPDLSVYNPNGPGITFQRNYRSDRALANDCSPGLSAGWGSNYDISIVPTLNGTWRGLTLFYGNAAPVVLTPPSSPPSSASVAIAVPSGVPLVVTGDDTNGVTGVWKSITVTMDDSSQWVFTSLNSGASYVLTQIISRTGCKLDLLYSVGMLSQFKDDATQTLLAQLNYSGGRLSSIQDKVNGRQVNYGYDGSGNLHTVSEAGLTGSSPAARYTYAYDTTMGAPLLNSTSVPDPTTGNGTGTQTANIVYNDTTGQVQSITDANGNQTLYAYVSSTQTSVEIKDKNGNHILGWTQNFDSKDRNTGTTDANGNTIVIAYNDVYNPLKPTGVTTPATGPGDTFSHMTSYTYDQYGHVLTVTSPRGVTTTYTYHYDKFALGRLMSVQETSATNSKQATSFTYYEPSGLVDTVTAPAPGSVFGGNTPEVTSTLTYDSTLGNLVKIVAPGNNAATTLTTNYNYTTDGTYTATAAVGEPLTVTDPNGDITHYRYDAQGLVRKVIDAMGNETDFDYALTGQNSLDEQIEKITYPATGLTGTGQAYTLYTYQYPGGPLASVSEYDEGNAGRVRLTLYGYGREGELLSASGSTEPVAYTYDPLYRLSTLTDGGGHTTSYYYDTQVGNLNGVTYPGYAGPTPVLDANHNYSNISGPDSVLYKTYDNADDATAIVDGRGDTTTYAYADPEYLPTSVSYTVPAGSPATALANTSYGYDWDGRLSTRTDASGGFSFAYDDLDGLTSKTTTYLAPGSGSLPAWSLSYAYYPDGSRQTMTLASGGTNDVSTYTYDKSGRAVKLVNPNGEQTTWAYQANDWLTAQTTNAGSSTPVETTYSYYSRGWMQELKTTQGLQGQGLTPTVIADFAGSGGSTPSMTYDALGNRASMTASGFPTGTGTFNGLTSFVYDARDELTSEASARDSGYTSALIYDGVTMNTTTGPGNATSERSVAFTFDSHGDNQIATDGGHYSWAYDGDGNPVTYLSKTDAFDPENRMTAYALPTGGGHASLTMGYDDDGMRAWKENSGGTRTYFLYDGSDLLAELTSAGALGTYETTGVDGVVSRRAGITTTYFAFDPSGSVSAVLNYTGTVRGDELFEANGRRDGSYSDRPVDFGGQWGYYADSETGLTLLGHRYYDSYAGRFLTRDPIGYDGGVNLYGYTANDFENEIDPGGTSALTALGSNPYWSIELLRLLGYQLNITATVFGGRADPNVSAYTGATITDTMPGASLPGYARGRKVEICNPSNGKRVVVPIVDKGPWYDGSKKRPYNPYWKTNSRPRAETHKKQNVGGIDLTPRTDRDLGFPYYVYRTKNGGIGTSGGGIVDWRFVPGNTK